MRLRRKARETDGIPFDKKIYKRGIVPNLVCALLIFMYSVLFLMIKPGQLPWALLAAAVITLAAEFIISPITNVILTKKITKDVQDWENGKLSDEKERTALYLEIAEFPNKKAVQTFLFFFICAMLLALSYRFVPGLRFKWIVITFSFIGCVFGGYSAAIIAQSYSEEVCGSYAKKLVKEGLDVSVIADRKYFGMTLGVRCVIYLIVPVIYMAVLAYMMTQQYSASYITNDVDRFSIIARNIVITIVNAAYYLKLCSLVKNKLCDYADEMGERLEEILTDKAPDFYIETNLFDSLQYSNHLVNESSRGFTSLISHMKSISSGILETSNNLAAISKELQATANEQNTSVTEINTTVHEMNSRIQSIKEKVEAVASSCETMDIQMFSSLGEVKENMEQIGRIGESNRKIMTCVEGLARQANSIDEVMNLIEDIASQTRIIAFNAELEAVGAGKAGKNFHIVSSEIKRLADSVVDSTKEIQRHIKDLKDASATLASSARNTTQLIETETEMSQELEKHLQGIKTAAEKNSGRAGEIRANIETQSASFEEIASKLSQINESIASFTVSTAEINSAASQIQAASADLDSMA